MKIQLSRLLSSVNLCVVRRFEAKLLSVVFSISKSKYVRAKMSSLRFFFVSQWRMYFQ